MIYNDYSEAYRLNKFDISNVNFLAHMVLDTYEFDASHKPEDIRNHVIISAEYLGENAMVTKGMGEITQMIKEKIKEEIGKNSGEVFEKIEKMFGDDPDKIQRIQEALMTPDNPDSENREFWEKLKEEGIKYFVVEYLPLSILCFCEEIDVM